MEILLDMDGVLAQFHEAAHKYLTGREFNPTAWKKGHYSLKTWLGLTEEQFWKQLPTDLFRTLRPTTEFKEVIDTVHKYDPRFRICTYPGPWSHAPLDKRNWLVRHINRWYGFQPILGVAPTCILTPNSVINPEMLFCADKYEHARSQNKDAWIETRRILIDDSDEQIHNFMVAGGYGILFPRVWNSNYKFADSPMHYVQEKLEKIFTNIYSPINFPPNSLNSHTA